MLVASSHALLGIGAGQIAALLPAASIGAFHRLWRGAAPAAGAAVAVRPRCCWTATTADRSSNNNSNGFLQWKAHSFGLSSAMAAPSSTALYLARHSHTSSAASQLDTAKQQLPTNAVPASVPDATDEAHTQPVPAAAVVAAVSAPLLPPRVKGIGRKMLLRQFNRTVVRRIARRATIGVPVIGLYFVMRILKNDSANLKEAVAAGDPRLKALFAVAVATELTDLAAQLAITAGTSLTSGLLPPHLVGLLGLSAALPSLPALLLVADKVSIACAAVSCCAGLFAEGIKAVREQDKADNTPTA